MKHLFASAALLLAACAAPAPEPEPRTDTVGAPATAAGEPTTAQAVAEANADFGVALYKRLAAEEGNVFLSPVSIAGAFGPVAAGARGETRTAIDTAMRFPGGGDGLHPALGGLLRDLERDREGATLSIANALWVQQGFALQPAFERTAREAYDASVDALEFGRAPAAAAERINGWVKDETRGRIPTLIAADSLDEDTRLVVTNAVYFLGDWQTPFNASNTSPQPFYTPGGGARTVPLMFRKGQFRYFETADFQAIDLPYKDERLSMSVFLPKARDGLPRFEAALSEDRLREWLGRLDGEEARTVRLHLPKLRIDQDYDLVPPLADMGMGIAFTDSADFRGIADADLYISQVVHKTFLRIDEKGTEAAAATGVEVELTSAPLVEPPIFRADHPFFFVLREKASGAILFIGRIETPPAE